MSEVIHLGAIEHPSDEQVHYFIEYASFMGDIAERGGITAEEAQQERQQALARIGMGILKTPDIPRIY